MDKSEMFLVGTIFGMIVMLVFVAVAYFPQLIPIQMHKAEIFCVRQGFDSFYDGEDGDYCRFEQGGKITLVPIDVAEGEYFLVECCKGT